MAPQVGFEPTTLRFIVDNRKLLAAGFEPAYTHFIHAVRQGFVP